LEHADERAEIRRARKATKKGDKSVKKLLRRENAQNAEKNGYKKVDKLVRRDFAKLNDASRFRKLGRQERRELRQKDNLEKVMSQAGLKPHHRNALRSALRRMQRRMRREVANKNDFHRELRRLSNNFAALAEHLKSSERRNARAMDRKWNRFAEKGKEGKDFSKIKEQIRREAAQGKTDTLFKTIQDMVNTGFNKDRKDERKAEDQIAKKIETNQQQQEQQQQFKQLEKATSKAATQAADAQKDTTKDVTKEVKAEQKKNFLKDAFSSLKKKISDVLTNAKNAVKNKLSPVKKEAEKAAQAAQAQQTQTVNIDDEIKRKAKEVIDKYLAEKLATLPTQAPTQAPAAGQIIYALAPRRRRSSRRSYFRDGFPSIEQFSQQQQQQQVPPVVIQAPAQNNGLALTQDDVHAIVYGAVRRALEEADGGKK